MTMRDMNHDCTECPLASSRRTFLQTAITTIGGTLATLGVSASIADALATPIAVARRLDQEKARVQRYLIPAKDGVQIDRAKHVILVRSLGNVYAFRLECPHQNTPLRWVAADDRFQCPRHHSQYAADGYFISGRATRGMDRYAVKRDGNVIAVTLSDIKKEDADPDGWKAAVVPMQ
jgi:Rieske Fe-S protein